MLTTIGPIPDYLRQFAWYAPHQAWLRDHGYMHHDPGQAEPVRANLTRANLTDANLTGAYLTGAYLTRAYLTDANLTDANLTGAYLTDANLTRARMPGFAGRTPRSLREAAEFTRKWLAEDHWTQDYWIKTPNGAYSGDCFACLHGAAVYCGGAFGPQLSEALNELGYDTKWNDSPETTRAMVLSALDQVIEIEAELEQPAD